MPFVNIQLVREKIADDPAGKKDKMARGVVEAIHKTTGIPASSIWVVFEEVAAEDWFVGETNVQTLSKKASQGQ
jgi:4-oxalocrotonate tautomerase